MSTTYRLVYASKNLIVGPAAEARRQLDLILDVSRRNNARMGLTGALIFNGAAFGQGLEGPRRALEETFERIHRDIRHGEVTVLAWGPVSAPVFSRPLDFVGESVRARAQWSDLLAAASFDLSRLDGDAVTGLLQRLMTEVGVSAPRPHAHPAPSARTVPDPMPKASSAPKTSPAPDSPAPDFLAPKASSVPTASLPEPNLGVPSAWTASPQSRSQRHAEVSVAILKAALADERSRTSALRAEIDELRIAIAAGRSEIASLRAERDLWAERARLMAAAVRDNPQEIRSLIRDAANSVIQRGRAASNPFPA